MPNLFNVDFLDFLEILNNNNVDYLLVGGYAVILHGYSRTTGDMDLWLDKTAINYFKLAKTYSDFGAPIFSEMDFLSNKFDVWSIGTEPRKIEILTNVDGLVFIESRERCKWFNFDKYKVPYLDFDDLIKNKLSSGRYKDLADIEQLNISKNKK